MSGPCLCGDPACPNCHPGSASRCICGEIEFEHGEHEGDALVASADLVLGFLRYLALGGGTDPEATSRGARDLLATIELDMHADGCRHNDEKCSREWDRLGAEET